MAYERNIIVNVEKGAAGVVVQVLHPSTHDLQRLMIGNTEISSEELAASRKSFYRTRFRLGETLSRNAEQQIGIGRERSPHRAL